MHRVTSIYLCSECRYTSCAHPAITIIKNVRKPRSVAETEDTLFRRSARAIGKARLLLSSASRLLSQLLLSSYSRTQEALRVRVLFSCVYIWSRGCRVLPYIHSFNNARAISAPAFGNFALPVRKCFSNGFPLRVSNKGECIVF